MLRFSQSRDGRQRATVMVMHRVGGIQLAVAAALLMDERYGASLDLDGLLFRARRLTRQEIEGALRAGLWREGDAVFAFANERTMLQPEGLWDEVLEACMHRVASLWPATARKEEGDR